MRVTRILIVVTVLFSAGLAVSAQTYNFGTPPTEAEISAMDTLVDQQGKNLPKGQGTASEGAPIYAQRCAMCHGPNGEGTNTAAGVGPALIAHGDEEGIKHLAFATTVFSYIYRAMPMHQERTLSVDQAYALSAFLLSRNGLIKENDVMNEKTLGKVKMPGLDEWETPSQNSG